MFILPHETWKDNIMSLILDWKQRSSGLSNKEERSTCLSSERRDPLVTQADLSAPGVCTPAVALLHKKGLRHRRKKCENSLWLYPNCTQSSLSKNKNIDYIFIHLRVLLCLSRGPKCDNYHWLLFDVLSNERFLSLHYLNGGSCSWGKIWWRLAFDTYNSPKLDKKPLKKVERCIGRNVWI